MTYGRPSMTSHLPSVPLPGTGEVNSSSQYPSLLTFYNATIELYRILDSILSDVYRAWRGRSSPNPQPFGHSTKQSGLDVIIQLEEQLFEYEANLPSFLSWSRPSTPTTDPHLLVLQRQRNVLHARYIPSN